MDVIYNDALARNLTLKPATEKREADIQRIVGSDYPGARVVWELHTDSLSRELSLVIQNGERQAEEPVSVTELQGNGEFDVKLRRMKDSLAHNGVWRVAVRNLIQNVRVWCADLPGATVKNDEVELNEERSGKYKLPALEIRSQDSLMWVKPVAGWVVNPTWIERTPTARKAVGRVDLRGPGGPIYLYCLEPEGADSEADWVYQGNALSPNGLLSLAHPLDKDSFLALAQACLDV